VEDRTSKDVCVASVLVRLVLLLLPSLLLGAKLEIDTVAELEELTRPL